MANPPQELFSDKPDVKRKAERDAWFRQNPLRVNDLGVEEHSGYQMIELANDKASAFLAFQSDGVCYIEEIDVSEKLRGQGIGTGVYERVKKYAEKRGASRLEALVVNEESMRAATYATARALRRR